MKKKLFQTINKTTIYVAYLCSGVLLLIMAINVIEVFLRYFFNKPSIWVMEVSQYMLCFISLLGGAYCYMTDSHVRIDLLYPKYTNTTKLFFDLIFLLLGMIIAIFIIYGGIIETIDAYKYRTTSPTILRVTMWPIFSIIPIAGFLVAIQLINKFWENYHSVKT